MVIYRRNIPNGHSLWKTAPAAMRLLQIVILTLIVVYPDDVLSGKGSKPKPKSKANKKSELGPCGKRYLRQINGKCYYFAGKKVCIRRNFVDYTDIIWKNPFVDELVRRTEQLPTQKSQFS